MTGDAGDRGKCTSVLRIHTNRFGKDIVVSQVQTVKQIGIERVIPTRSQQGIRVGLS